MIFLTVGFEPDTWSLQQVAYFSKNTRTRIQPIDLSQSKKAIFFTWAMYCIPIPVCIKLSVRVGNS